MTRFSTLRGLAIEMDVDSQELLALAKNGKITSLVAAGIMDNGNIYQSLSGDWQDHLFVQIATLEKLKYQLLEAIQF